MHDPDVLDGSARLQDVAHPHGYYDEQQQVESSHTIGMSAQDAALIASTKGHSSSTHQISSDEEDLPLASRRVHDARLARDERLGGVSTTPAHDVQNPSTDNFKKKPGPKPWAAKPIAKNDMKAKTEVIKAIEQNWGKNFIQKYIPKCHRPLQKTKGNKRLSYRQHETDPKKWLPSILKSILGVSHLTKDKAMLRKAMTDIVRHRIKHTGNRKPQLVTTDFDVIEDMINRGWDIETSFSIRYKHLLLAAPKGYTETDEDIDHILACGSDDDIPPTDDDDAEGEETESEDDLESNTFTSPYFPTGNYIHGAPHRPPKMLVPTKPRQEKQSIKDNTETEVEKAEKRMKIKKEKSKKGPTKGRTERSDSVDISPQDNQEVTSQQSIPEIYGGYGMPGYDPYGGYPVYHPVHPHAPPGPVRYGGGYPTMAPMYPWPSHSHHPSPGYGGQQQPGKQGNFTDPRLFPHVYPPCSLPGHGYHGMPAYPPPMTRTPSLPRSTPGPPPSFPRATPAPNFPRATPAPGFSRATPAPSFGVSHPAPFPPSDRPDPYILRLDSSFRPDAVSADGDPADLPRVKRIKREPDTEEPTTSIEVDDNQVGSSHTLPDDSEQTDEQMLQEIWQQERRVLELKARLAKKRRG